MIDYMGKEPLRESWVLCEGREDGAVHTVSGCG